MSRIRSYLSRPQAYSGVTQQPCPSDDIGVSETVPVPHTLLRRLWIALAAGLLSLAITTIQGAAREDMTRGTRPSVH